MKTTQEIADKLVSYCRKGQYQEAQDELYSEDIISIEPAGTHWGTAEGMDAVRKKGEIWKNSLQELHRSEISDPLVAENYFSVRMLSDATFKDMGRMSFEQLAVYEVNDGKVTKEQFFYTPPPQG